MQRQRVLIIDGYNVIRNNERYLALGADFEGGSGWNKAREALIDDAATYAHNVYQACTIVFDGAGNPASNGHPYTEASVEVVFSPSGVSADSVIERTALRARSKGLEVVVVSSDFAIQSTVFGKGVSRMSAAGFGHAVDRIKDEWREEASHADRLKNTVADRIDPELASRLSALRDAL